MGMIFSKYACGCLETDCPLCPCFSDSRHFWALSYKGLKGVKMINVSYILTPNCI